MRPQQKTAFWQFFVFTLHFQPIHPGFSNGYFFVTIEPADAENIRQKWETWGEGVRMVMLDSPYRLFLEPIPAYIADIARQSQPGETITIVVNEFVAESRLTATLHTNTADLLRSQLNRQHGIVIINVPYHVHEEVGEH